MVGQLTCRTEIRYGVDRLRRFVFGCSRGGPHIFIRLFISHHISPWFWDSANFATLPGRLGYRTCMFSELLVSVRYSEDFDWPKL